MEYCDGGELFDRIVNSGFYAEEDAKNTIVNLLESIAYLHSLNIVHRDLKPENLLMASKAADAEIKVADFGLSTYASADNLLKTSCGTLTYCSPEILAGKGYGKEVGAHRPSLRIEMAGAQRLTSNSFRLMEHWCYRIHSFIRISPFLRYKRHGNHQLDTERQIPIFLTRMG